MAPVIRELEKHPDHIVSRVCVTAQHREMLDQVLDLFGIKPDYDLNVMQMGQTPTAVASVILMKLEPLLDAEKPDWVLVQGDTTTVMSASIAAYFARAKVGHIEAGLRTYDKWQPFPEEINRRVAGVIADLHFAPTEWAAGNLLREGVARAHIIVTGNTVIDAVQQAASLPYDSDQSSLSELVDHNRRLILVTAHRRENFGKGITEICRGLRRVARHYDRDVQIIYPVHLNPNVQQPVYEYLDGLSKRYVTASIGLPNYGLVYEKRNFGAH